jgi:hypothetical protein
MKVKKNQRDGLAFAPDSYRDPLTLMMLVYAFIFARIMFKAAPALNHSICC